MLEEDLRGEGEGEEGRGGEGGGCEDGDECGGGSGGV